jgi:uncharacterized protein (TIGR02145 family)
MKISILLFLFLAFVFACTDEETGQKTDSSADFSYRSSSSLVIVKQDSVPYQGRSYKAVKIGSQTWLAENLNAVPSSSSGNWWCYANLNEHCTNYGKLYDWQAAMNICPDGWKLPSVDDYENLSDYNDVHKGVLQSTSVWDATFGGYKYDDGRWWPLGEEGFWWSSTNDGDRAKYFTITKGENKLRKYDEKKTYGLSVRCIKK